MLGHSHINIEYQRGLYSGLGSQDILIKQSSTGRCFAMKKFNHNKTNSIQFCNSSTDSPQVISQLAVQLQIPIRLQKHSVASLLAVLSTSTNRLARCNFLIRSTRSCSSQHHGCLIFDSSTRSNTFHDCLGVALSNQLKFGKLHLR